LIRERNASYSRSGAALNHAVVVIEAGLGHRPIGVRGLGCYRIEQVNRHFAITTNEVLRIPATISVPPQQLLERILTLEIVRVTERAAVSAARLRGHGNKVAADQAAVDAMRRELNKMPIDGTVVIGEGERDEAPMLFIGGKVGNNTGPKVDVAVDPLDGRTLCAKDMPGAIATMAMAEGGTLLNAPDVYMQKIAIGPGYDKGVVELEAPPVDNIRRLAKAKGVLPSQITALVMIDPDMTTSSPQCAAAAQPCV
jgi:fructose-1,6-bisphosphatase II / sedoheptulose-1,7-bisphosphatase